MEDLLGTALRETVERACRGWPRSKDRSRRPNQGGFGAYLRTLTETECGSFTGSWEAYA